MDEDQAVIEEVEQPVEQEQSDVVQEGQDETAPAEAAEAEEITVQIGDEPPAEEEQAGAPEWVKDLRKKNREDQRRIRELEDRLKEKEAPAQPSLGAKPKLEDYDYDADQYEAALSTWFDRKRQHDDIAARADAERKAQADAWQAKLHGYNAAKTALKVPDYEDAEMAVQSALNVTQQGVILQGAENAVLVVYALGKNPAKAKELGAITDPVKFAFAVAKLESQLKVTSRKPPPPEKEVIGSAPRTGTDSHLERLRSDAAKTGDFTKVAAYKAKMRKK